MSKFPLLKTGAVLQYPAQRTFAFSTAIARFIDGSEQRFPMYDTPLHRWIIQLEMLDDSELHQLREFFRTQSGAAGNFTFTDPWDGTIYESCSFVEDEMIDALVAESNAKTSLTVAENRS